MFSVFKKIFAISKKDLTQDSFLNQDYSEFQGLFGKDFEFLLEGDFSFKDSEFDLIMTPDSLKWEKIYRNDWAYYKVGNDQFSYSLEPPGYQMTFNEEISFDKALIIAKEIINKIKQKKKKVKLVVFKSGDIYSY